MNGSRVHRLLSAAGRTAAFLAAVCLTASCTAAHLSAQTHSAATVRKSHVVKRPVAQQSPMSAPGVVRSLVRCPDGSVVAVALFIGQIRYALHNGTTDPGPAAASVVQAGPQVSVTERPRLLATFNGGFKMNAKAGGYMQEGHVIRSLRTGFASLVIDRNGRARIGVWGHDVPAPGEQVYSVRQNLWALVQNRRATAESALWRRWGGTVGHQEYVARSALGENEFGQLMYAGSMRTTPADLAYALIRSGAVTGMEMDINPYWVQLDVADRPGGPLTKAVPGQEHPADQYVVGWYRDFITVLAA
jgi:hypothetical protein